MKTNIARQAILNEKNETIAYKLLFRGFNDKSNTAVFDNGSQATTEVIKNWLINFGLDQLTNHKRAFINFTEELILDGMPRLLRKDSFIIELESKLEVSEEVIISIAELKSEGYNFALNIEQILNLSKENKGLIEIIKFDFLKYSHDQITKILKSFNQNDYILLAEKVETIKDFEFAKTLGFEMFQGFYFAMPTVLETTALSTIPTVYLQLIKELNKDTSDAKKLAEITKQDVSLTYSVLNIVNSVAYYSRRRIKSLKDAYTRLGMRESKKIIYYNFLKAMTPDETPGELIKRSLTRGKQAELLATTFHLEDKKEKLFLLGLLSLINIILKDDMSKILKRIHLSEEVCQALLGYKNDLSNILDLIILYERNSEEDFIKKLNQNNIALEKFTETYITAFQWSDQIFE
ncbi:MAG TPA: HDOD domain-containing protein [Clostridia bacterium]|nr:HDOD domain-containing protein [Clostridia bacterium]